MISFKNTIHNWIRDIEHQSKERLSSKPRNVTSKHSSSRKSSSSSSSSRPSKDKRALQEKLRIVEFLAIRIQNFQNSSRRSAKIHGKKLKIEKEFAKSKAMVKILEAIESEDYKREFNVDGQDKGEMNKTIDKKPGTQHQRNMQYHYDQASVDDGKSHFSLIKQSLHEETVRGN